MTIRCGTANPDGIPALGFCRTEALNLQDAREHRLRARRAFAARDGQRGPCTDHGRDCEQTRPGPGDPTGADAKGKCHVAGLWVRAVDVTTLNARRSVRLDSKSAATHTGGNRRNFQGTAAGKWAVTAHLSGCCAHSVTHRVRCGRTRNSADPKDGDGAGLSRFVSYQNRQPQTHFRQLRGGSKRSRLAATPARRLPTGDD